MSMLPLADTPHSADATAEAHLWQWEAAEMANEESLALAEAVSGGDSYEKSRNLENKCALIRFGPTAMGFVRRHPMSMGRLHH